MILNSTLDIIIYTRLYLFQNIHYIDLKLLEDHRTERRRKEDGMSMIGGLKALQDDTIME